MRPRIKIVSILCIIPLLWISPTFGQKMEFSRSDSLRGMLGPARTCFDVRYYELDIEVFPKKKSIKGTVKMHFDLLEQSTQLQLDLFRNMRIDSIMCNGQVLNYYREEDAFFVDILHLNIGHWVMNIHYHGTPVVGKMLPWDGGFLWTSDQTGSPWITVACEGTGASLWWPNKDHLSDEPDSLSLVCTVPNPLQCISNGTLLKVTPISTDKTSYLWKVHYPINNYNVTLNIGSYSHFSDTFVYENDDKLTLDYYVMPYNLEKAKIHFKQVGRVLEAYAHYLGPYPYVKDGYALVETPYLGMEHQGAIAYGNKYQRGYLGGMQPKDMHQDYIIVHETGHEYFGNWISCKDHAEMWIHESFTTYLESLYVEYFRGKEDALRYLQFQRPFIKNKTPLLGPLGVNYDDWGSSDIYYKGSWMLQTLRTGMGNDEIWFGSLRSMIEELGNQTVTSDEIIDFFNRKSDFVWDGFFKHYLQYAELPVLVWKKAKSEKQIALKWESPVDHFELPLHWDTMGELISLSPGTNKWTYISSRYWDQNIIQSIRSRYLISIREEK